MQGKTEKQLFIYRKYVSLGPPAHLPRGGVIPLGNTGFSIYTFLIWLSWWLSWCLPDAENCFPYAAAGSGPDPDRAL